MTTPPRDCVTNSEFNRYLAEEAAYRGRVADQLKTQYEHISAELSEIKGLVRETNGRVGKSERSIAIIEREVEAIKSEDQAIEKMVEDIQAHGCHQLANHTQTLEVPGWSPKKTAAAAGGLVGLGALIWPAVQQIAEAIHALLEWLPK
jgi:hypothetical protein